MGLIRALLALSVVFTHAGGLDLVGGRNAVQIFYMISGFLISYVITERKSYVSVGEFYISRYARLWPQYFIVAAITLAIFYFVRPIEARLFFKAFEYLDIVPACFLAFSNAFLVGQDWMMFAEITMGDFVFSSDFHKATLPAYLGLLTPQSWTLGVELTFYAIAPFVLPRRWLMLVLVGLSVAIRIVLVRAGVGMTDPWTYRFFPAELLFFLIGSLVQQLGLKRYQAMVSPFYDIGVTMLLTGLIVGYALIPAHELLKSAALMGCFAIALPALFRFQHGRKWDVLIGNLSYPIYINHILIITVLHAVGMHSGGALFAIVAAIFSVIIALAMNSFIASPVDNWRKHLRRRSEPVGALDARPEFTGLRDGQAG